VLIERGDQICFEEGAGEEVSLPRHAELSHHLRPPWSLQQQRSRVVHGRIAHAEGGCRSAQPYQRPEPSGSAEHGLPGPAEAPAPQSSPAPRTRPLRVQEVAPAAAAGVPTDVSGWRDHGVRHRPGHGSGSPWQGGWGMLIFHRGSVQPPQCPPNPRD